MRTPSWRPPFLPPNEIFSCVLPFLSLIELATPAELAGGFCGTSGSPLLFRNLRLTSHGPVRTPVVVGRPLTDNPSVHIPGGFDQRPLGLAFSLASSWSVCLPASTERAEGAAARVITASKYEKHS